MQRAAFLQGIAGAQPPVPKRYKELEVRVQNTVDRYLSSEILVYTCNCAPFLFMTILAYSGRTVGRISPSFIFHISFYAGFYCVSVTCMFL